MKKKERWVVFREEKEVVDFIDNIADLNGVGRSSFIRQAIRKQLAESKFSDKMGLLDEQDLGVGV